MAAVCNSNCLVRAPGALTQSVPLAFALWVLRCVKVRLGACMFGLVRTRCLGFDFAPVVSFIELKPQLTHTRKQQWIVKTNSLHHHSLQIYTCTLPCYKVSSRFVCNFRRGSNIVFRIEAYQEGLLFQQLFWKTTIFSKQNVRI